MEERFLDLIDVKQVIRMVNITSAGIYGRIKAGTFPSGVKIGSARLWKEDDITRWIEERGLEKA